MAPQLKDDMLDITSNNTTARQEAYAQSLIPNRITNAAIIDANPESDFPYDREAIFLDDDAYNRDNLLTSTEVVDYSKYFGNSPLKRLNAQGVDCTWKLIDRLEQTIPQNEFALPIYYYRADMLNTPYIIDIIASIQPTPILLDDNSTTTTSFVPVKREPEDIRNLVNHVDAALTPLYYIDGIPTQETGRYFWECLPHEPQRCHDAFLKFLEIPGIRKFSDVMGYNPLDLREWYYVYYWAIRAKAFDLYKVAHHQRMRLQRMLSIEDNHFKIAAGLLAKLENYLGDVVLDEDNITPEKAVNIMEKLVKIQRISVGLPANGESKESLNTQQRELVPTNVVMQQITQNNIQTNITSGEEIDILLEQPEAVEAAQDLIIKMQKLSRE